MYHIYYLYYIYIMICIMYMCVICIVYIYGIRLPQLNSMLVYAHIISYLSYAIQTKVFIFNTCSIHSGRCQGPRLTKGLKPDATTRGSWIISSLTASVEITLQDLSVQFGSVQFAFQVKGDLSTDLSTSVVCPCLSTSPWSLPLTPSLCSALRRRTTCNVCCAGWRVALSLTRLRV